MVIHSGLCNQDRHLHLTHFADHLKMEPHRSTLDMITFSIVWHKLSKHTHTVSHIAPTPPISPPPSFPFLGCRPHNALAFSFSKFNHAYESRHTVSISYTVCSFVPSYTVSGFMLIASECVQECETKFEGPLCRAPQTDQHRHVARGIQRRAVKVLFMNLGDEKLKRCRE